MALNRFMHPRNIYKTPPNFEKLTNLFSEFSGISKMDAKGKVTIDFKDPKSLRVLTKCLLKADFNLDVEIPEDRLVPTLPLRLNYVLWIEDLTAAIGRDVNVRGIDIGTGACAIYPMLAAVRNKWFMVGTEMDVVSLKKAQENIERNNLQELIHIKSNEGTILIENLFTEEGQQVYDFCMCNPPFYSNLHELCESRSPARPPPKNGFTGSVHELITEGGELEFCRKLIRESKNCKNNVILFTTMIGHKYNLSELLQDLKAANIKHTHTEFCQGRVTRWGLAWTYQNYDIYKLVSPREKLRKKNVSIIQKLPELKHCENSIENSYSKIKEILGGLKINFRVLNKCGKHIALDVVAYNNTWSNQRRKKRLLKRLEEVANKKFKPDLKVETDNYSTESLIFMPAEKTKDLTCSGESIRSMLSAESVVKATETESMAKFNTCIVSESSHNSTKLTISESTGQQDLNKCDMSGEKCDESSEEPKPLIQAFVKMFKKEHSISIESEFIKGTGGKESLHQIIQYIKNNWK